MQLRTALVPLLLAPSSLVLAGCVLPGGLHQPNLARQRQSIAAAVPLGASVATARKTMEAHGYRCQDVDGGLACDASGTLPYEIFTREWHVRFAIKDGRVADYQATTQLDAP